LICILFWVGFVGDEAPVGYLIPDRGRGQGKSSPRKRGRGLKRGNFDVSGRGTFRRSPAGIAPLPSLTSPVPLAPIHHPLSCPLRAAAGGASIQIQVTLRRGDCFSLSSHSGALQSVASCSADYLLCCDRFFMVFCRFSALLRALESKSFSFIFFVADLFICITLDLMRGGDYQFTF